MMIQTKKARLSTAIAAVLGGAALSAVPFAGQAQDTNAPVGYSPTETGQAMIVPYYTVNNNWWTAVNVTNTSASALAVKVRVHEAMNSRDVLDFTVMLSPYDVWTAYLNAGQGEDAAPLLIPTDNSCTTPAFPAGGAELLNLAFTGPNNDGGPQESARMNEGYVEFLVMGECAPGDECLTDSDGIGYLITHDSSGEPRNCAAAQSRSVVAPGTPAFPDLGEQFGVDPLMAMASSSSGPAQQARSGAQMGWSSNVAGVGTGWGPVRHPAPLKGNVTYVNTLLGAGAGTQALHLDSVVCSAVPPAVDAAGNPSCAGIESNVLMTAQSEKYFLEPTIATMPTGLWDVRGLNALENRFTWSNVYNEWAANAETSAYTNWVINFPTKGYHVDQNCSMLQANNNAWRNDGVNVLNCSGGAAFVECAAPTADGLGCASDANSGGFENGRRQTPYTAQVAPFTRLWSSAGSPVTVSATVYDRDEQTGTTGPIFSPAADNPFVLAYETNVIEFVPGGVDPLGSSVGSFLDVYSALSNPDAQYGWIDLAFNQQGLGGANFRGLPVYGFAVKLRQPGGAPYVVGQMMDHGYGYTPN